jgi:hypothetical protein
VSQAVDPVFDWGTVPLTRSETQGLELYASDSKFYGCEVYCGTCPRIHYGRGVRATCCRDEPEPTPSRLQRLKARVRCLA